MGEPYGYLWFDKNGARRFTHAAPTAEFHIDVKPVYEHAAPSPEVERELVPVISLPKPDLYCGSVRAFSIEAVEVFAKQCAVVRKSITEAAGRYEWMRNSEDGRCVWNGELLPGDLLDAAVDAGIDAALEAKGTADKEIT